MLLPEKWRIDTASIALSVAVALYIPSTIVKAATVRWTGNSSTDDWFDAGNWNRSPSGSPVAGDNIYIGTDGVGAANGVVVIGSGSAQGNQLILGYRPATTGELTIRQGASLALTGRLTLGTQGNGTLNIDGGTVSASLAYVGYYSSTVAGTGKLEITNGGVLNTTSSSYAYIGYASASAVVSATSSVLIDGGSSAWKANGGMIIGAGNSGSGTVTVRNGALLELTNPLNSSTNSGLGLADGVNATGKLTITGPGSTVTSTPGITIGIAGSASLSILDGGTLQSSSDLVDYDYIGYSTTLAGVRAEGHVLVDGPGSSWINSTGLIVGYAGIGTLTISNGATVTSTYDSFIGRTRGSIGSQQAVYAGHGEVLISGHNSLWTTRTLDMAVSGEADAVLTVSDGGTLRTTGSDGIRIGNGGSGVINIGAPADQSATSPGHIESDAIQMVDRSRSLINFNHTATDADNYTFSASLSGDGTVDVLSGVTLLTGSNTYSGLTTISAGVLKAGSGSAFSPNSDFAVKSAGMLNLNGIDQTVASLMNAGLIRTSSEGAVGTTLTVSGDYTGMNGNLHLRTELGADNSLTDRLIINGAATGQTFVSIINADRLGAQTTGDGILIIETGSSTPQAFMLSGRVVAGAYDYSLEFGGSSATGGNPNDQNWYLRNTLSPEPPIVEPENPEPPVVDPENPKPPIVKPEDPKPPVVGPENPESPQPENPVRFNYRPEFPLMASMVPIASEYGYALLDTLHERIGEVWNDPLPPVYEDRTVRGRNGEMQVVRTPGARTDRREWISSGWARLIGNRGFRDNGNFERHGPDYSYTFAGIQAGLDVYGREQIDGTLDRAGLYAGYGTIGADVKGAWRGKAGSIDMDAFTLGAYWTHKAPQGWYTDSVVQGTWYSAEAKSVKGEKLKPDGFGFIASLEGGYSFNLGNGLTVEPQAQLAYQNVSFDDVSVVNGRIDLSDGESLRGRLGLRITKRWNTMDEAKPQLVSTWLRANVWHEFMGDAATTAATVTGTDAVTITSSLGGTWGEIGAGISGQISDRMTLFATGAYNRSLDNKGREAWNGRLGATVRW